MLYTEQSTAKEILSKTTLTNKRQRNKLSASWKLVDGKLVCFWSNANSRN